MTITVQQLRDQLAAMVAAIDLDLRPPPLVPPTDVTRLTVSIGADLASVLDTVPPFSVVTLPTGFSWNGDLQITKPLSLRGPSLPAGRVGLSQSMPTIHGTIGLFAPDISLKRFGLTGTRRDSILLTLADRSLVDQCAILGSPDGQHRGIRVDTADCFVTRSSIANIWHDQDGQSILAGIGTSRLLVDDCYLEASGENMMIGGIDPPSAAAIPSDITVQNCSLFKPLEWVGKQGATIKNLFEIKDVKRAKFLNNVCQNSWVNGQIGFGLVLTVRNQDGTAPWSTIEDVLVDGNTFRHCEHGINVLGTDNLHPSGQMKRVTISHNQFTELGHTGDGNAIQIDGAPEDLTFDGNTFDGNVNSFLTFEGQPLVRFVVKNNRFAQGQYGIHSSDAALGLATLQKYAPGFVWENNTIVRGDSPNVITYPPGTIVL